MIAGSLLVALGAIGIPLLWGFGIRPYVVRARQGYRTGANMFVAMWVDWQSCRELEKGSGDAVGWWLCWVFIGLHFAVVVGGVMLVLRVPWP